MILAVDNAPKNLRIRLATITISLNCSN